MEDSVHAARPQRRRPRRSRALRGTVGHPQHQARDHGGDQRDPGTQGRHGGLRDDRGFSRHPLHPAGQPAQPLRHHLDQAEAAGQAAALLRGQREDHGRRHGPRAARRGRGPHHRAADQGGRLHRGGGPQLPVLIRDPGPRTARQGDPGGGAAGYSDLHLLRRAAQVEGVRARVDHHRGCLCEARGEQPDRKPARALQGERDYRSGRRHQVQRRRDDARGGAAHANPDDRLRPHGRGDRGQARRQAERDQPSCHPRHGRHVDRHLHDCGREGELHHRLRGGVRCPHPDPDDRHPHHRCGRRLHRLDRQGRHAARRARKRGRESRPRLLRQRWGAAGGHRRQPAARPDQPGELPRR